MPMRIVTTQLSVARELWRYGEPHLAEAVLALSDRDVLRVGIRTAELATSGLDAELWADGPGDRALLLAAIERLEGRPRPARRRRRLPEKNLPPHLQATEEQRWDAALKVARLMDELDAKGEQI